MGVIPFSDPYGVQITLSLFSGGLRYASTTGYYLAALRAASSPINFRMHRVPARRFLKRQGDAQRRRFVIQTAGEHDCLRQMLQRTIVSSRNVEEAAGQTHRRVARQGRDR